MKRSRSKKLKEHFIPSKANRFKPYFFHAPALGALLFVIILLFALTIGVDRLVVRSNSRDVAAVISAVLVDLSNGDRESNGLGALRVNPVLERAAQMKADDMAARGYFAHDSPDGLTPWHWFKEAGYDFSYAGENLAVYFSDSLEVEKAWMNSPAHRANILSSHFTEIGIATAQGTYQGRETTFVVQEFGRPASSGARGSVQEPVHEDVPPRTASVPVKGVAVVKGAETKVASAPAERMSVIAEDDTFIAIRNVSAPAERAELPAREDTGTERSSMFFWTIVTSPHTLLRILYGLIAALVVFALALLIGIELRRQHPFAIASGVSLVALMAFFAYVGLSLLSGTTLVL